MFTETRTACSALFFSCVFILNFETTNAQTPIEPLLQKYCLGCHNDANPEVGLSLQTPDSLKKGSENGSVLNPEDLHGSLLFAVLSVDAENSMPPVGEVQPTKAEREQLRQWVLNGALIKPMAAGPPDVVAVKPFGDVVTSSLASAVSGDGKQVVVGGQRFVSLRNALTDESIWTTAVPGAKVSGLMFASTKPWIVAAAGMPGVSGKTLIISQADGTVLKEFGGHTDAVYAAVLNSSDTLLATAGYDRRIVLHDVASGKVLRTLEGHNGSVFSLCFAPDGRVLCSASGDGTVKVWHVDSGERLDTLSQPQAEQYTVLFSHDGKRILAAGADNRIRIWQLLSQDKPTINPLLEARFAHEQPITRLAISAAGDVLASAAEDGTLRVWSVFPLRNLQTLPPQDVPVTSLSFISSTQLFVTHIDGATQTFSINSAGENREGVASPALPVPPPAAVVDLLSEPTSVSEQENNNTADVAQRISLPAVVSGMIFSDGDEKSDTDCFEFAAVAGQELLLEIRAARDKSPLDSRIEVLTSDGRPVLQTRLQAVRDSYFTFRGKDSDTSDDFRVFNWQEMELNEYLYSDGEVVRLWLYPRGPDSGFKVYPGHGKRFTYFGTTPTSHALQAPCFVVVPKAADEPVVANGLPTFPIYYENDDDSKRELGTDSRLFFTAPADGEYVVRVTDARGFGGVDFKYQLVVRAPQPSFEVTVNNRKLLLHQGTGQEIVFSAKRIDGYEGPISIDVKGLPEGFGFSGPIEIEEGQLQAFATVYAKTGAIQPTDEQIKGISFVASTETVGEKTLAGLDELKLAGEPKIRVRIDALANNGAADENANGKVSESDAASGSLQPVVLQIRPGQTIQAIARVERLKHKGVISFGKEDSGRNLPHGVFVDNIGLNGLLLLEGQSDRDFFVTAAKWVQPSTSTFFLKSNVDGITTLPVTLQVLPAESDEKQSSVAAVAQ